MASETPLVLAFLFGFSSPAIEGDAACNRIRERERRAYCHCITAHGGTWAEGARSRRPADLGEQGRQARIMACMEKRGFGV